MNRMWMVAGTLWAAVAGANPAGGWIGWAYLGEGGDLPLRVWLSGQPAQEQARFDGIPWGQRGWPAALALEGEQAVMTLTTPRGSAVRLAGPMADGRWSGRMDFADYSGEFELLHAPDLADIDPEQYADVAGYYRMDDGDVLEARALGWGELVLRSVRTGEQRTLLPSAADRFFTGPARYVPTPVEARYEILRDDGHGVAGLIRRTAAGTVSRGQRFELRRDAVSISSDGATLAGTVTRPADDMQRAGIVVLGGSSWETRNALDFQVRNLAAMGFTVIHWDKRGFGESSGTDPVPFATTAADAVAAARALRERDDVGDVGYFGMSRGGWTAPLAVTADARAEFLMLLVPPATSPAVQEHGARLARLEAAGLEPAQRELADRLLTAAWRFVETGAADDCAAYRDLYRQARERSLPDDVLPPGECDPEAWRWARMNMLFDPAPVLRQIRVPVLAVFGEQDADVITRVHRPRMQALLNEAGNRSATVVTVPGVGHGLAREWGAPVHRTTGIGPEGFDAVLEWSRAQGLIP